MWFFLGNRLFALCHYRKRSLKKFVNCVISNHSPPRTLPLLRNITAINPTGLDLWFHLSIYMTEANANLNRTVKRSWQKQRKNMNSIDLKTERTDEEFSDMELSVHIINIKIISFNSNQRPSACDVCLPGKWQLSWFRSCLELMLFLLSSSLLSGTGWESKYFKSIRTGKPSCLLTFPILMQHVLQVIKILCEKSWSALNSFSFPWTVMKDGRFLFLGC